MEVGAEAVLVVETSVRTPLDAVILNPETVFEVWLPTNNKLPVVSETMKAAALPAAKGEPLIEVVGTPELLSTAYP